MRTDPVDQNLVEFTDLAPRHHREGQHVPERKAEIVGQHVAARARIPSRDAREHRIDLTRAGGEIDARCEPLD